MRTADKKAKESFAWGAPQAIAITLGIYVLTQIGVGLILILYAMAHHWSAEQANQWLHDSIAVQFLFIALVEASTLGLLYLFLHRTKKTFRDIGLKRTRVDDLAYALGGFAVYFSLTAITQLIIHNATPININQKQQVGFAGAYGGALILVFIALAILAPITEEIMVRGFLYGSLKKHWPKVWAVLITSALFAAAHLQLGGGAPLVWSAALDTFILSLVLIYIRDKSDGLAAPIMLHMLKNGLAFLVIFVIANR